MVGMGRWPAQSVLYHKELPVDEYLEYHLDLKGLLRLWAGQDLLSLIAPKDNTKGFWFQVAMTNS
jgi:hypothetical protein